VTTWIYRVKRFYVAARMISAFKGTITDCDDVTGDVIVGDVIGPMPDGSDVNTDGEFRSDARFYGCLRCPLFSSGAGCADNDCGDTVIDFYDEAPQDTQQIDSSTFIIKSLSSDLNCDQIRAETFP
jgi:hypothetical protein